MIFWKKQKGITLYLSIMIVSIGFAVALGISDILLRELKIQGNVRPSGIAFYAADAGTECALRSHLADNSGNGVFDITQPSVTVNCNNQNLTANRTVVGGRTSFDFNFQLSNDACIRVTVSKQNVDPFGECTRIDSYGTNYDCVGGGAGRATERGILVFDPEACFFAL